MQWEVPRMWEGGECWIIGGGPSMLEQFDVPSEIIQQVRSNQAKPDVYSPFLSAIHDKHVIGVNMAFKIGPWLDMVFFGDRSFFMKNQKELALFPGLRVTSVGAVKDHYWIKHLVKDKAHSVGITRNPRRISWGSNSGSAAISVAAHTGAKRIILLGFDMIDSGQGQWWHGLYKQRTMAAGQGVFKRHLRCFPAIAKDAKELGIEILNASPKSAIECFRKVNVKELL